MKWWPGSRPKKNKKGKLMQDILLFNPRGLLIALINYAIIHYAYKVIKRQMNKRGIFKADVLRFLGSLFSDRKRAIWQHHQLRAAGAGHTPKSAFECSQENCQVFA